MSQTTTIGGSARSRAEDLDESRWSARPGIALLLRTAALLTPVVAAFLASHFARGFLPTASSALGRVTLFCGLTVIAVITMLLVDRVSRRLLPIAALFRLSLVFPDRAPSRFSVSLRSGSSRKLEQRIETGTIGPPDAGEAARDLLVLITALGRHDRFTRGHSERVRAYSDLIAAEMGLSARDRDRLQWAALAHDVGKLDVRPAVLAKPAALDDAEWREMREHPAAAMAKIAPLRAWLGDWSLAATQHHERWDGSGYPLGLTGNGISLSGRIVAVADAYDVMTSARSYKAPLNPDQARAELAANAGSQFDPDVVRAFLNVGLGRVRNVLGPLAWLGGVPALIGGATQGVNGAMSAAAVGAIAAVAPTGALIDQPPPAPPENHELAFGDLAADLLPEGLDFSDEQPPVDTLADGSPGGAGPLAQTPGDGEWPRAPREATTTVPGSTSTPTPSVSTTTTTSTTSTSTVPTSTTLPATTTTSPAGAPPPQGPDAEDDDLVLETPAAVLIAVLDNDRDPDGQLDPATLRIDEEPQHGTAVVVGDRIRYTPGPGTDEDEFRYEICDDGGRCDRAKVRIEIASPDEGSGSGGSGSGRPGSPGNGAGPARSGVNDHGD